jgi:hypothetical protein
MSNFHKALSFVGILAISFFAYLLFIKISSDKTLEYLSDTLRFYNLYEEIILDDKKFLIQNGSVISPENEKIAENDKLIAMQVASIVAEARFAPLLAVAGTNPKHLKESVNVLEKVTKLLADAQKTKLDKKDVAMVLYPIDFLRALANLEEKRLALLSFPSEVNADAYEQALFQSIDIGLKHSAKFSKSLERFAFTEDKNILRLFSFSKERSFQFYSLSGTITDNSLLQAAKTVEVRLKEVKRKADARHICRTKINSHCNPLHLSVKDLYINIDDIVVSDDSKKRVDKIQNFFLQKSRKYKNPEEMLRVKVEKSVCARELAGPYNFLLLMQTETRESDVVRLLNELHFRPTDQSGPALAYLGKQDVNYLIKLPLAYYNCFESQSDLGLITALKHIFNTATENSFVAVKERDELLEHDRFISEVSARKYINVALKELEPKDERRRIFEELDLVIKERNADLDKLIYKISEINHIRLQQQYDGLPFDVSAHTLFLTHSAFPSLFLAHSPSAGDSKINLTIVEQKNKEEYIRVHKDFFELEREVGIEKLIDDTREFYRLDVELYQ